MGTWRPYRPCSEGTYCSVGLKNSLRSKSELSVLMKDSTHSWQNLHSRLVKRQQTRNIEERNLLGDTEHPTQVLFQLLLEPQTSLFRLRFGSCCCLGGGWLMRCPVGCWRLMSSAIDMHTIAGALFKEFYHRIYSLNFFLANFLQTAVLSDNSTTAQSLCLLLWIHPLNLRA